MERQKKFHLPNLDFALPLYTTLQIENIRACHADVAASRDLSSTILGGSAALVQAAVAESAKAEAFLDALPQGLSPEALVAYSTEGLGDFSLAALAQLIWEIAGDIDDRALMAQCYARNTALFVQALLSSDASVLLDYDWMYIDMANSPWLGAAADPLDLLERGLTHNLAYNGGDRAVEILLNMASIHLMDGAWTRGIGIYADLIWYDPCDFEIYDALAADLANLRETSFACRAAKRGMVVATRDPSSCRKALLAEDLRQWEEHRGSKRSRMPAEAQAIILNALHMDAPCGATIDELCAFLFPHLDEVPLKQMPCYAYRKAPRAISKS